MQWLPVQAHIVLYTLTSFTLDCHNFAQGSGTLQCHPVARSFRCSVVVIWGLLKVQAMNLCESWPRNAFTDIISLDAVVLRRETRRPIGFGMYRLGFSCRKIAQCWDATVEQKYANVVQCIAVTMTALSAQVVGLPIAQLLQSSFNTSLTRCTAQKSPTFNVCYILWLWLLNIDTWPHITLKSTCVKVLTPVGPFLVGLVWKS